MRPAIRLISVAFTLASLSVVALAQEDIQLRQEAVTLVERANVASIARPFAPYEQTIVFHAYSAGKGTHEGRFTSVTIGPRSYRDEHEYSDFHLLVVVNGDMIADVGNRAVAPFEESEDQTTGPKGLPLRTARAVRS